MTVTIHYENVLDYLIMFVINPSDLNPEKLLNVLTGPHLTIFLTFVVIIVIKYRRDK